jgi:hypothetical protein
VLLQIDDVEIDPHPAERYNRTYRQYPPTGIGVNSMTTRERWIVYPLLFLTLGIVMRDKFFVPRRMTAGAIHCRELETVGVRCSQVEAGRVQCVEVAVGNSQLGDRGLLAVGSDGSGRLVLAGDDGRPVVAAGADPSGREGLVEVLREGTAQVELRSSPWGGAIAAMSNDKRIQAGFAFNQYVIAVFARAIPSGWGLQFGIPRALMTQPPPKGKPAAAKPPASLGP